MTAARVQSFGHIDTAKMPAHPIPRAMLHKVTSTYGYFSGYRPGCVSVGDQINRLRRVGITLGRFDEKVVSKKLPSHAEGWFVRPHWQNIAPTYIEAILKVLELLRRTRDNRFYNYREGLIEQMLLHHTLSTVDAFSTLEKMQYRCDTLILPAQFGIYYRGHSEVLVEEETASNEFPLDTYTVGIMLLSHPMRLNCEFDLGITCGGDICTNIESDEREDHSPHFISNNGELVFGTGRPERAIASFGTATGFIPQL